MSVCHVFAQGFRVLKPSGTAWALLRMKVRYVFAYEFGIGEFFITVRALAEKCMCLYDVRFVYENGQSDERRRVNLCEVTNLILPLPRQ